MICPRCTDKFFSRNYSTRALHKTVKCPSCNHRFPAPLRKDARTLIKDLLHDDFFSHPEWKQADLVERVKMLVSKVKGD